MQRSRETVAIIGEGITEKYYVLSLRDLCKIKPTPIKPKNSSLKELEISIKDCVKKGYSRIFCLIDKDNKIIDGNPDHERNAKDYSQIKKRYNRKQLSGTGGSKSWVYMIESFPATEIFFLWYLRFSTAYYTNQQLKELLHRQLGYQTEEKYFIRHSIHETLLEAGGSLDCAINHSLSSMNSQHQIETHSSYTEIGIMVKCLLEGNFENL